MVQLNTTLILQTPNYTTLNLIVMLKLLLLLNLLNAATDILTGGKLGSVQGGNKQGSPSEKLSHHLKRAVGGLG